MNKKTLEDYLIHIVVPDIMQCMNENSQHNRTGIYGFECEDKKLNINFEWNKVKKSVE